MRQRRVEESPIARRLRELGCSEEQVQRHLLRGKHLLPVMRLRPRPNSKCRPA